MNYYIDFDNTLYETAKLTSLMLNAIATTIAQSTCKDEKMLLEYAKENFNSTNDNIFTFAEKMSKNFEADSDIAKQNVNKVIDNGKILVFDDAIRFLEKIKENGDKIFILTYIHMDNQEYQMRKIIGSGISKYFDGILMTTQLKFMIDLKYENGIFIDDDPRDLQGLLSQNPIRVIRIKKPSNRRSKIEMNNEKIEEYTSFDDITI